MAQQIELTQGKFAGILQRSIMIKKVNEHTYEIDTAGLGSKMFFHPWSSCGHIRNGIGLGIEPLRAGWVIPLSEAWQMVLLATVKAAEQNVQRIWATVREKWQVLFNHP